jgi:hypothetical protein
MSACGLGRVNVITSRGLSESWKLFATIVRLKLRWRAGGKKGKIFFAISGKANAIKQLAPPKPEYRRRALADGPRPRKGVSLYSAGAL